jgi:hypothetical protein
MTRTKKDVYESALASGETDKSARAKAEGYPDYPMDEHSSKNEDYPEYEVTQIEKEKHRTDTYWKEYFITLRWIIGALLIAFVAWLIFSNSCSAPPL